MNTRDFRHRSIRWLAPLSLWGSLIAPATAALPVVGRNDFAGSAQCAACHRDIASVQTTSEHARSLRKVAGIPGLAQALPLRFSDQDNGVEYRIERSNRPEFAFDLVAVKGQRTERLRLIWGFGAGRKGITFVGRTDAGEFGESRVSWYPKINGLDITTGGEPENVSNAHGALARWFEPERRKACFACHVTRQADVSPDRIEEANAGVRCERCHGPGGKHIEAVSRGTGSGDLAIGNPGKLRATEQLQFCGDCHRLPSEDFSRVILNKATIRFPAQRLVLSRCYDESEGRLKCTTCHNPHEDLAQSPPYYDQKCRSCHASKVSLGSLCPVSTQNCVSCHMPREPLMKHADFTDHWIRKVRTAHP